MRKFKITLCIVLVLLLNSCSSIRFFQVYDVNSSAKLGLDKISDSKHQNDDCIISYDFWGEAGDAGFEFYNKTDKDIYLHLDECFFIMNGIAKDYYKNRIYTSSVGSGLPTLHMNSLSSGVMRTEKKVICIPSKTSKYIREYKVSDVAFRDCNLLRFPKCKDVEKLTFSFDDSPFVFSNLLRYSVGKKGDIKQVETEFFVSSIQNINSENMISEKIKEFCGEKRELIKIKTIKRGSHSQFYIEYTKKENAFKH